jgi:hypothetical protein
MRGSGRRVSVGHRRPCQIRVQRPKKQSPAALAETATFITDSGYAVRKDCGLSHAYHYHY